MDERELSDQLYSVARDRAATGGRRLGEGADNDLREMTAVAAVRLLEISNLKEREAQIEEAKASLRRLIDIALVHAKDLKDYPTDLLGEATYFPAKFRFCPCRPFC